MTFLKENECIKIGREPDLSKYFFVIILNLAKFGQVTLSSRGTNTFSAERITTMLKSIGIEEVKREDVEEDGIPTLKICLSCPNNSPLRDFEDYIDLEFVRDMRQKYI